MGERGPKKQPSNLVDLRGNPGKREVNKNEPKPKVSNEVPKPPKHVGKHGKKIWRKLAPELHRLGLLTEIDLQQFELYCYNYNLFMEARISLESSDKLYYTTDKGGMSKRPEIEIINKAVITMDRIGKNFGLDPSSRTTLKVSPKEKENKLLKFINGGASNSG